MIIIPTVDIHVYFWMKLTTLKTKSKKEITDYYLCISVTSKQQINDIMLLFK